ncbi:MAG: hypothetical protein HQK66_10785 [Desulfamplus sp.]|nr:hypothetical protein [Desulfamplus sp.]
MLEPNQIKRLLDIAALGCHRGHAGLAREIITGLDQLLENSVELEICRAMSYYTVDQFPEAIDILSSAGEKFPGNPMITAHMALVEILMDNGIDARKKLDAVAAQSEDLEAKRLAEILISQYF